MTNNKHVRICLCHEIWILRVVISIVTRTVNSYIIPIHRYCEPMSFDNRTALNRVFLPVYNDWQPSDPRPRKTTGGANGVRRGTHNARPKIPSIRNPYKVLIFSTSNAIIIFYARTACTQYTAHKFAALHSGPCVRGVHRSIKV